MMSDPIFEKLQYIRDKSSLASQCEMLAEEAVELAHAAQKVARYFRGEQPLADNFDLKMAEDNLLEEFADTMLSGQVLIKLFDENGDPTERALIFDRISRDKADRWINRLSSIETKE